MSDNPRLKRIWYNMIRRCHNPNTDELTRRYYYDKGIRVCDEWKNSFESFREWALAHGYTDKHTIDRIDSDGNYEPGNCQWLTKAEHSVKTVRDSRLKPVREVRRTITPCTYKIIKTGITADEAKILAGELNAKHGGYGYVIGKVTPDGWNNKIIYCGSEREENSPESKKIKSIISIMNNYEFLTERQKIKLSGIVDGLVASNQIFSEAENTAKQ